jgi:NADH-quinone oxidoreductase subunit M
VAGVVISAVYGLRAAARVLFGEPTAAFVQVAARAPVVDLSWSERIPALLLLASLLFIGFFPRSIARPINLAVSAPSAAAAYAPR